MDVKVIDSFILIQKIKEYQNIKDSLLMLIDKMPDKKTDTEREKITKSDWYIPKEHVREYGELFLKIIKPYNDNIKKFYNAKELFLKNYWYQQYTDTDHHDWHVHASCLLSNVFYIELKNKNSTLFYNNLTKQKYSYNLEEGDLITFPSSMIHKSKKNSKERKTIISYNLDFDNISVNESNR
jgi:hypothetical protein|tara:strand:+ start:2532 stop:3077 length:546 start_codon:yes stop_codon:yes gene_type:complete